MREPAKWPQKRNTNIWLRNWISLSCFFSSSLPKIKKKQPTHNHLRRISDESKQQIAFILDKISALRPAEKLLLYLKMPGGHSDVGEYFTWSYQKKNHGRHQHARRQKWKTSKTTPKREKILFFFCDLIKKINLISSQNWKRKHWISSTHVFFWCCREFFDNDFILLSRSRQSEYTWNQNSHTLSPAKQVHSISAAVSRHFHGELRVNLDREWRNITLRFSAPTMSVFSDLTSIFVFHNSDRTGYRVNFIESFFYGFR